MAEIVAAILFGLIGLCCLYFAFRVFMVEVDANAFGASAGLGLHLVLLLLGAAGCLALAVWLIV